MRVFSNRQYPGRQKAISGVLLETADKITPLDSAKWAYRSFRKAQVLVTGLRDVICMC